MQRYTVGRLDAAAKGYLATLPACQIKTIGYARYFLCHAIPSDPIYGYLQLQDARARWEREIHTAGRPDFLLVGHTHRPFISLIKSTLIVNPGSVGQPRDGDPRASYMLVDTATAHITWHRVSYDLQATQQAILAAGLPPDLALRLAYGQ